MAKKIGVLLAGCGVFDGAEIHEAVLTLLYIDQAGMTAVCMAPDVDQMHVINHVNQQEMAEKRNVLVEAARIARGEIVDIASVKASELDALIIPGGFGAAKNLSDFAVNGPNATVHPEVERLIGEMHANGKVIGAICIAPATLVRALPDKTACVTIGNDQGTAGAIAAMGGSHVDCSVSDICVDEANRIVSTPAYMLGPGIKDVAVGIEELVEKVISLS